MRLVKVRGLAVLKFLCRRCKNLVSNMQEDIWADIDSPAFSHYYCSKCKEEMNGGIQHELSRNVSTESWGLR